MIIGVPKEIKDNEYRVALTPAGTTELINAGHKVFIQKSAGIGSGTAVIITIANVVGLGWQKRVFQATGWAPVGESKFLLGIHPVVM
ncbi:unnamed protein product, partial [marine sediment metagenome]